MNKKVSVSLQEVLKKKLKDPTFKMHFEESRAISDLCYAVTHARQVKGITQQKLAKSCGTTQSVIARLEGGNNGRMPSLDLLQRIADALNLKLIIGFEKKKAA